MMASSAAKWCWLVSTRDTELRAAKALVDPVKPVVVVLTEGNPTSWGSVVGWANDEMKDLCDFQKKMFVDLSKLAGDPGWTAVDGPSEALLKVKEWLYS